MIGSGLGAEKEVAFKTKRLKGLKESEENGGRGIPCKLCWLFHK